MYEYDQLKKRFKHCTKVTVEEFYTQIYTKDENTGKWLNEDGSPFRENQLYFEKYIQMCEENGHIVTLEFAHHDKLTNLKKELIKLVKRHADERGMVHESMLEEKERLENEISALESSGILNKCEQCGVEESGVDFGINLTTSKMYCQDCGENIKGWC